MHASRVRLCAVLLIGCSGLGLAGCGGTEVKLADVPREPVKPKPKLEDLPKDQRPRAGSSAGMDRDPSGMGYEKTQPK